MCGLARGGWFLGWVQSRGGKQLIATILNISVHKIDLHLTYNRLIHFKHTCYSLPNPIWYICFNGISLLGYMLRCITSYVIIRQWDLPPTVATGLLAASTDHRRATVATCPPTHTHSHDIPHIIFDVYQILTWSLIHVIRLCISITNVYCYIEYIICCCNTDSV